MKKLIFLFLLAVSFTFISIQSDSIGRLPNIEVIDSLLIDTIHNPIQDSLEQVKYLARGKSLYEKTCNRCHSLYEPGDFTLQVWRKNLKEMKIKAGLKEDQYKNILAYLAANCRK